MTYRSVGIVGTCVVVAIGGGTVHNADPTITATSHTNTFVESRCQDPNGVDVAIGPFLRVRSLELVRVLARSGSCLAVEVRLTTDDTRYVIALTTEADSVATIREPIELMELGPWDHVHEAEWMSHESDAAVFLRITFDNPVEKPVGTHLYRMYEGQLIDSFHDSDDVCTPAELRDVNADGQLDLISWGEDPTPGDCSLECEIHIRSLGVSVAWPTVHRWSNDHWIAAESDYTEFYKEIATRYDDVLEELPPMRGSACAYAGWTDGRLVAEWAERARGLAEGGI